MPRDNRCMYMAHTCLYVRCSDCVVVCMNVCCVTGVIVIVVWLFTPVRKKIELLQLSIDGKPVECVNYFKFLGILFDENLTWKWHINMVTNKLLKVIGILNRLKHAYPQNALLSIYNSLFTSHLNYGLLLWGTNVNRVSKLHKKLSESCLIAII